MASIHSIPSIWDEIERSESYLVASMYEEAASVASSVLNKIRSKNNCNSDGNMENEDFELFDIVVSAGMVFVQSLSRLGRASEILKELKLLFTSVEAIPVQVLLTGVCLQISEGSLSGVRESLEEFLGKWQFVHGRYYVLVGAQMDVNVLEQHGKGCILGIDEFMDVVEIYAVTLLGTSLKDLDSAIDWVEKAALPDERRQGLLRRLHSLYSSSVTNLPKGSSFSSGNNRDSGRLSSKELNVSDGSSKVLEANYPSDGEIRKQTILKLSKRVDPCFWWFRGINLKFGNVRFVITNRKLLLGSLLLLICYVLRQKQATLRGIIRRRALSIKKALTDLWQLTFSYQVNPLAAVQPLPSATRGGQL